MNIILKPFNCCPECLNTELITDLNRLEIYCSSCGLVVKDPSYLSIETSIKAEELAKQKLEELKKVKELEPIINSYKKSEILRNNFYKNRPNFFSSKKQKKKEQIANKT